MEPFQTKARQQRGFQESWAAFHSCKLGCQMIKHRLCKSADNKAFEVRMHETQ